MAIARRENIAREAMGNPTIALDDRTKLGVEVGLLELAVWDGRAVVGFGVAVGVAVELAVDAVRREDVEELFAIEATRKLDGRRLRISVSVIAHWIAQVSLQGQ